MPAVHPPSSSCEDTINQALHPPTKTTGSDDLPHGIVCREEKHRMMGGCHSDPHAGHCHITATFTVREPHVMIYMPCPSGMSEPDTTWPAKTVTPLKARMVTWPE